MGGIYTGEDVLQMIMAGASAVQLYTLPALRGPRVFKKIINDLREFFDRHKEYTKISDIIGISHQWGKEHTFEAPRPRIIIDRCVGCKICIPSCAFDAIKFVKDSDKRSFVVINDNCVSCNACVGMCPFNAIEAVFKKR